MKIFKIILLMCPLFLVVGYFFIFFPHSCKKSISDKFYLDYDFETVRKTFVRTKAKERLIELNQGQIISQKIEDVNVSTDKILKGMRGNWRVEGSGVFNVKFQHAQLGDSVLNFKQTFFITTNSMIVKVYLLEPSGNLHRYEHSMTMSSFGDQTKVETETFTEIKYNSPNIKSIQDKIDSDTIKGLEEGRIKFRDSLSQVIKQYKDQVHNFKWNGKFTN